MPLDPTLDAQLQELLARSAGGVAAAERTPEQVLESVLPLRDERLIGVMQRELGVSAEEAPPVEQPAMPAERLTPEQEIANRLLVEQQVREAPAAEPQRREPALRLPGRGTIARALARQATELVGGPEAPTVAERVSHAGQAAARGLTRGAAGVGHGIALGAFVAEQKLAPHFLGSFAKYLTNPDKGLKDYTTWQYGEALVKFADEHFAGDPRLRDSFLTNTVPEALGTMVAFFFGGGLGRMSRAARLGFAGERGAVMGLGAGVGAGAGYERAVAQGATEEEAESVAMWNAAFGTTEWLGVPLPAFKLLNRLDKSSGGKLRQWVTRLGIQGLVGGTQEAAQESLQQFLENATIRQIVDENQPLFEAMITAGGAGGIVGLITNTIAAAVGLGRRRKVSRRFFREAFGVTDEKVPNAEQRAEIVARRQREETARQANASAKAVQEDLRLMAQRYSEATGRPVPNITVVPQEVSDAGTIRSDQAAVPEAGVHPQRGEATGGEDIQRQPPGPPGPPGVPPQAGQVGEPFGRPELASLGTDEATRHIVDVVDEIRKAAGVPTRVARAEMAAEANTRLAADPTGERARLADAASQGRAFHLGDTVEAKTIIRQDAEAAIEAGDIDGILNVMDLSWAVRDFRSDVARELGTPDTSKTPEERRKAALAESMLTPPEAERLKLKRAYDEGDMKTAEELRRKWAQQVLDLRDQLALNGVDLAVASQDEIATFRAMKALAAMKAPAWDKVYEYWRNSILSAPATQVANFTGNLANAAWYMSIERLAATAINTIVRDPKGPQWGEFKHLARGLVLDTKAARAAWLQGDVHAFFQGVSPGLHRGIRNFWKSYVAEVPILEAEAGRRAAQKVEEPTIAIGGRLGGGIRTPQRTLLAVDELQKAVIAEMEVGARAFRRGKAAGLEGDALQMFIAEETADIQSASWADAIDVAQKLAFQEELGRVGKGILFLRRTIPGLRYVIPFVTTLVNIVARGINELTPVGSIGALHKLQRAIRTGDTTGLSEKLGQQLLAWSILALFWDNDENDPWITGAVPETRPGPRRLSRETYPTQSVKISGRWWEYSRLPEPFSTAISLCVDAVNAVKSGQPARLLNDPIDALLGQIKNKTFMAGIADILNAIDSDKPIDSTARWASGFGASWVPNIIRASGRATKDYIPERRVWGRGKDWWERLGRRTLERAFELPWPENQPAYDNWGREVERPGSPYWSGPLTDWLWRMMIPVEVRDREPLLGPRVIAAWNREHPEDPRYIYEPRRRVTLLKKEYDLTDAEYAEYHRLSGEIARRMVDYAAPYLDPDNVTEWQVDVVKKWINKGRAMARKRLARQWMEARGLIRPRVAK